MLDKPLVAMEKEVGPEMTMKLYLKVNMMLGATEHTFIASGIILFRSFVKFVLKERMLKCILQNSWQTSNFLMPEGDIAICPNCVRAEMHFKAHE